MNVPAGDYERPLSQLVKPRLEIFRKLPQDHVNLTKFVRLKQRLWKPSHDGSKWLTQYTPENKDDSNNCKRCREPYISYPVKLTQLLTIKLGNNIFHIIRRRKGRI